MALYDTKRGLEIKIRNTCDLLVELPEQAGLGNKRTNSGKYNGTNKSSEHSKEEKKVLA